MVKFAANIDSCSIFKKRVFTYVELLQHFYHAQNYPEVVEKNCL